MRKKSEHMTPEDKAIVDKEVVKMEPVAEIKTDVTPTIEAPVVTDPPKKKGFLKLPFFKRKQEEAVGDEKVSDVAAELTNESLLKMIDDKLQKINGDEFLTIKISKQGLLVIVGLILLMVWLFPLIKINLPQLLNGRFELLEVMQKQTPEPTPEAELSPTPIPMTDLPIRVRMGSNSLELANEVEGLLLKAGFTRVDMIYDADVNPKSLLIVTRPADGELQQKLNQVFTETYMVSSEAAELTSDSDFSASILVGKSAKISK